MKTSAKFLFTVSLFGLISTGSSFLNISSPSVALDQGDTHVESLSVVSIVNDNPHQCGDCHLGSNVPNKTVISRNLKVDKEVDFTNLVQNASLCRRKKKATKLN